MKVKTEALIEGCILLEDVFSKTNRPIMKKNVILTNRLIEVLHLFLIPTVDVHETLVSGKPFVSSEKVQIEHKSFVGLFLEAVQEYKRHFKTWQSGSPIDIAKIREFFLPLIEEERLKSSEIIFLHHLSNVEEYSYQHAVALGILSAFIARQLKYPQNEVVQIALAGLLADCGMAKVSPGILKKGSALASNEFDEIKKHPQYSYEMIKHIPLLKEGVKVAVFQHHERIDGSGYPLGAKSGSIHQIAQIIAVADTFHAMTSERLYRTKQSPFNVLESMRHDLFGKLDLLSLRVLSDSIMNNLAAGGNIKLSNDEIAEVLFVDPKTPTRPLIKLIKTEEILNLAEHRDLYIEEIISPVT